MNPLDIHDEWLSLIEVSGPFLATPVLKRVFSTGLPAVEPRIRQYLRQAYDEWCEARDNDDPRFTELHRAWIHEVLARGLEYDETDSGELLLRGERIPSEQRVTLPEHGVTLEPDYALVSGGKSRLLVQIYSAGTDLQAALKLDGWSASPAERMERLCRVSGCRLGLVTNGERWMLVDAPVGAVSTFASWYARLWGQERLTLQAFLTLLGIRRFFGPDDESLPSMLDESLQHQEEVTDALGEQVRRAVEVLIQALGKEDRERSGALLQGVEPTELYEAGLTIMMRLVFLLSAEERGLLLMGEEAYESNYAISTLRMQLRQETEEVLERRNDAWSRLLATFRAVYGGIEHEMLRLPALGGSLFDPDRFPFLEGRSKGSDWRIDSARPLPIDNRTVLLLLDAIQQYEGRTLSYRALDVEQIGYVYEGLLERTVSRIERVTVELAGGKAAKKTLYALEELEALHQRGREVLVEVLSGADALKRGGGAIRKDLERSVDAVQANRLLTACAGDEGLRDRALPFLNLLRTDPWGYPLIYPEGAFIVTTGSDRRETGTHYTPKSLTETIVDETLTPLVYTGPAEGTQREQWVLKSPAELLDLKICDPAMGSGAFLVQVCRWLADRLVEAWSTVEDTGKTVSVDGEILDTPDAKEPLPLDAETRTVIARRLIAERCLYGVDLNPLAVELAKLSIWLVTMAKSRPFGFLDHNLRCGDSLLGIHQLEQLTELSMTPGGKGQQRLFGKDIEKAVHEAIELRQRLREMPIRDIQDVEAMARLDADARLRLEIPEHIADALIGEALASGGNASEMESGLTTVAIRAPNALEGDIEAVTAIIRHAKKALSTDLPSANAKRKVFHWPLQFPEVFSREKPGFDSIIGNPPYFAGAWLASIFGKAYRSFLVAFIANGETGLRGTADLCTYFILKAQKLVRVGGDFGLVVSSTVAEGDSKQVGLAQAVNLGSSIFRASETIKWPGAANVDVVLICLRNGSYLGEKYIGKQLVESISPALSGGQELPEPVELASNKHLICKGHELQGDGFKISASVRDCLIESDQKNGDVIFPLITGDWLNNSVSAPSEFVINFEDRTLDQAQRMVGAFAIVEEKVKPDRMKYVGDVSRDRYLRTYWWLFRGFRAELKSFSSDHEKLLALSVVTKHLIFRFIDSRSVPTAATTCILSDSYAVFAQLQSSLHDVWARAHGSSLGETLRYIAGRCFKTYPLLAGDVKLDQIGKAYYDKRASVGQAKNIGYTDLYNKFHNPALVDADIFELREMQVDLDRAILGAYGWDDLDLCHGFHQPSYLPENDRVRFTISEDARHQVLRRLADLNQSRSLHEAAQATKAEQINKKRGRRSKKDSLALTNDLFNGNDA